MGLVDEAGEPVIQGQGFGAGGIMTFSWTS